MSTVKWQPYQPLPTKESKNKFIQELNKHPEFKILIGGRGYGKTLQEKIKNKQLEKEGEENVE